MKKIIFLFAGLAVFTYKNHAQTVTDIDGNLYHTVIIGSQVWMVENLKTTRYNDGTEIPLAADNAVWENLSTPGYCWYNNDAAYKNKYGALYNWYTINKGTLAPLGWHIPADSEWNVLIDFLGGATIAGGKMKSTGTIQADSGLWNEPNTGATDSSGFTALPGGYRYFSGPFNYLAENAFFWSSSMSTGPFAWCQILYYDMEQVFRGSSFNSYGFSARCVRDLPSGIHGVNDMNILKIYPNPATDNIYIDCTDRQDLNISIYNLFGKLVEQKRLER